MHRTSFFVCIPISFSLVYRSGAFGWIDAAQVSKNESLAHLSSIVADRVVVRGGHCYYRVVASSLYVSRCILISIARLVDFQ